MIKAEYLVGIAKDLKIDGKYAVVLLLGAGGIWLLRDAMEHGYAFSASYQGAEISLNPPNTSDR